MAQLEHIEAIEKRLWSAADTLRANSNYASNEYFLPVMGLVFLRHAYSRFLAVKDDIESKLPKRGGKTRELAKEDFSQKSAIFLRPKAQFDYLVALPDSEDRAKAIIGAMESIEQDYENLLGVLPKGDYQELDNVVLGQLLRTLNPDELKRVSGDVFGRIYEYFLTQFADQKAHDDGEFFTPVSLVSLIAHVLEPDRGTVLDPACGSGGMFVQSARIVEERGQSPTDRLTFRGLEKNATTIRLAKMNLTVHGLEGDIQKAITYYEDPHELLGKADYVMANPPFNVDEIDADKVKNDPRLPFGLPGITNGLPEGWDRKLLGDVAATNRDSYRTGELPEVINYVDISSVAQGDISTRTTMTALDAPGRARRKCQAGDVIWSNVRPNLRAYALVLSPDENDVFSTGFTVLSPTGVPFSYLYLLVTTDEFVGHLVNHTTGASYPAVRPDDFERASVLVPSEKVLTLFHEVAEPIFRQVRILRSQTGPLAKARDLLLPRLMNGEIPV